MNSAQIKQKAWQLYREYLQAKNPTESQAFLAQEALVVLIRFAYEDFDRKVAQYNLACLYIDSRRYDLAEKLPMEIRKHGGSGWC